MRDLAREIGQPEPEVKNEAETKQAAMEAIGQASLDRIIETHASFVKALFDPRNRSFTQEEWERRIDLLETNLRSRFGENTKEWPKDKWKLLIDAKDKMSLDRIIEIHAGFVKDLFEPKKNRPFMREDWQKRIDLLETNLRSRFGENTKEWPEEYVQLLDNAKKIIKMPEIPKEALQEEDEGVHVIVEPPLPSVATKSTLTPDDEEWFSNQTKGSDGGDGGNDNDNKKKSWWKRTGRKLALAFGLASAVGGAGYLASEANKPELKKPTTHTSEQIAQTSVPETGPFVSPEKGPGGKVVQLETQSAEPPPDFDYFGIEDPVSREWIDDLVKDLSGKFDISIDQAREVLAHAKVTDGSSPVSLGREFYKALRKAIEYSKSEAGLKAYISLFKGLGIKDIDSQNAEDRAATLAAIINNLVVKQGVEFEKNFSLTGEAAGIHLLVPPTDAKGSFQSIPAGRKFFKEGTFKSEKQQNSNETPAVQTPYPETKTPQSPKDESLVRDLPYTPTPDLTPLGPDLPDDIKAERAKNALDEITKESQAGFNKITKERAAAHALAEKIYKERYPDKGAPAVAIDQGQIEKDKWMAEAKAKGYLKSKADIGSKVATPERHLKPGEIEKEIKDAVFGGGPKFIEEKIITPDGKTYVVGQTVDYTTLNGKIKRHKIIGSSEDGGVILQEEETNRQFAVSAKGLKRIATK